MMLIQPDEYINYIPLGHADKVISEITGEKKIVVKKSFTLESIFKRIKRRING